MATIFWDSEGVVLHNYLEQGNTSQKPARRSNRKYSHCTESEETREVEPRGALSPGHRKCTHVISSAGSCKKFPVWTTQSPMTIFARSRF